jgi:hypothetical protein
LLALPIGSSVGKALGLTQGLRAAILSGQLVAGVRLPPTRVLAAELGVSRGVVVQAYTDLAADGYLEARQGAGTRVSANPPGAIDRPAATTARPAIRTPLLHTPAPIRLLGGVPDPRLFPRTGWVRHYRAALAAVADRDLGYPDHRGAADLRRALSAHLGRVRGVMADPDRWRRSAPQAAHLGVGAGGPSPAADPSDASAARRHRPAPAFSPIRLRTRSAGWIRLHFKLSKAAAKTLRRRHKLRLSLRLTFTPVNGPAVTRTATLTLYTPRCSRKPKRCSLPVPARVTVPR